MKTVLRNIFTRVICTLLSAVMIAVCALNVFAAEEKTAILYVKDVKLIYAESLDEAKAFVSKGYRLLEQDLNAGTDSDNKVYFVYSTTADPNEAITDLKMMNMKGGFVLSDYEDQIKNVKENVRNLANDVKISAELFAVNYVKGTYGAMAAYRALSAFTVDEAGGKSLADYIVYDKPGEDFYIKFVLNTHKDILSAVISALAIAVQGEAGNTWLDRLAAIENPSTVREQPTYWDNAIKLWEHFYGFYKVYNTIDHSLYSGKVSEKAAGESEDKDAPPKVTPVDPETQPNVEYNGTEALYEVAYKLLDTYKFKNDVKFSKWFLGKEVFDLDEERFENFYAILEVMTDEELAMMRLSGPLYMILATGMDETAYNDYVRRIEEITDSNPSCSIWEGVNTELFSSSIGITDEAARKIAETKFERELNNAGDSTGMAGLKTAGLIAACGAVSLGLGLATYFTFGPMLVSCFIGGTFSAVKAVVSICGTIFGAVTLTLGIAVVAVALVIAVVYFIVWLVELYEEKHPEYTEIPEFMYDYVEDGAGNSQFVLYEGVKFQDGRIADVNVWEGKEWHAMYASYDKAAGAPIEADFIVRYSDGNIDKGYAGLSNFGRINAQNLNTYAFEDEVGGIHITYRQEDLDGDYAKKDYLSKVKLFSGEDAAKVALKLKNEGYILYDINLTPDSDYITYLGYKTTNNVSRALTDIRLAYAYNSYQYNTGGSSESYAAYGSTGDGMLTLYATSISLFGTPIRSDFLILNDRNAPKGYEPVNLFSGGPAVNFNLKDSMYVSDVTGFYFYYLPTETYTGGTEYLGGLALAYDVPGAYSVNGGGSVSKANNKYLGYKTLFTSKGDENAEAAILYTTTYNPYRAIYNVMAVGSGDDMGNVFSQTAYYDGVGYSLVNRYMVTHNEKVRYEGNTQREGDARLYVSGIYFGGSPMTVSQIYASNDQEGAPSGMTPVTARLSGDDKAVNIGGGLNFIYHKHVSSVAGAGVTKIVGVKMTPFYLFVSGRDYVEGNHLTDIYLTSKESLITSSNEAADLDCDDVDNAYIVNQLAAMGAHTAILKNLNLADEDNVTYLGYTKKAKKANDTTVINPITNIILYYAGETDVKPTNEDKVFGKISYKLAGNLNLFCEEDGTNDTCERVYLYYTTNPAAGSPIIDIKIDNNAILNGWETARTQNGKALYDDMDDYSDEMWFIHMKRTTEDPKYIAEVVVGVGSSDADAKAVLIAAGCDYMLEKDLNNNVGLHSDYVYLGYKRTSDPSEAIRDLKTTHNNEVDGFVKNGATYHKIDGNLNSYTNVFADDIFLYYTKDEKAGTPITSLGTSGEVANWSHGEGNRYVVKTVLDEKDQASDLNDGAGGDYIYLLQTRDKTDESSFVGSMLGSGSVVAVITLAVVSAGVASWFGITQKKRHTKLNAEEETASENE